MFLELIKSILPAIITGLAGPALFYFLTKREQKPGSNIEIAKPFGYKEPKKSIFKSTSYRIKNIFISFYYTIINTLRSIHNYFIIFKDNIYVYFGLAIICGFLGTALYNLLCPYIPCCITDPTPTPTIISIYNSTSTNTPSHTTISTNTFTPTSPPTDTIALSSTPTLTPLPLCDEQISIFRPKSNDQIIAFRKQAGNLYWFDAEGKFELCPSAENEEPPDWSILFITTINSPKCIMAYQIPIENTNDGEWYASVPILDTVSSNAKVFDPAIHLSFTIYLLRDQQMENFSFPTSCGSSIEDYGFTEDYLNQFPSAHRVVELFKLEDTTIH